MTQRKLYSNDIIKNYSVLIPALEDPEPRYFPYALPHPCYILTYSFLKRVHAHAAAALINFCEGI